MATNDQDYRTGMNQGHIGYAYETLTDHRLAGLSCRDWETCNCTPCLARKEIVKLRAAVRWALGEEGDFPGGEEPPPIAGVRQRFFWRAKLRAMAGMSR